MDSLSPELMKEVESSRATFIKKLVKMDTIFVWREIQHSVIDPILETEGCEKDKETGTYKKYVTAGGRPILMSIHLVALADLRQLMEKSVENSERKGMGFIILVDGEDTTQRKDVSELYYSILQTCKDVAVNWVSPSIAPVDTKLDENKVPLSRQLVRWGLRRKKIRAMRRAVLIAANKAKVENSDNSDELSVLAKALSCPYLELSTSLGTNVAQLLPLLADTFLRSSYWLTKKKV